MELKFREIRETVSRHFTAVSHHSTLMSNNLRKSRETVSRKKGDGGGAVFDSTESVIADLKRGKMVILVDDADRENEGDLIMAAEHVTPEAVNFMAKFGRGLICV